MTNKAVIKKSMIVSLIAAILALLVAFGSPVTQVQQDTILSVAAIVCTMIISAGVFGSHLQDDTTTEESNEADGTS